jgi:GcrA cell cycle regulator
MEWSKTRVEALKRMWAEGTSARMIAESLGGGATRNSVIGKAYRLGLSKPSPSPRPAPRLPERPLAGILNLTERMCRWPSGHPGQAGFGFCGEPVAPGRPYCAEHCSRAYSPRRDSAA